MEMRICRQCGQAKDARKFGPNHISGYARRICKACYGDKERARLKLDMLNAFDRKCECCGEMHPEFLSLEHRIPGNGELGTGLKSHQLYRLARQQGWPKEKYACLCMNCNYAKGHVGYCPHQSTLSVENWYQRYEHLAHPPRRLYGPLTDAQRKGLCIGPMAKQDKARARWEMQKKLLAEQPDYYRNLSKNQKTVLQRRRKQYDA